VSSKRRRRSHATARQGPTAADRQAARRRARGHADTARASLLPASAGARIGLLVVVLGVVAVAALGTDFVFGSLLRGGSTPAATPSATPSSRPSIGASQFGVVVQGQGGHWTNVRPDELAYMLEHKDFTLLNVRTPYVAEIAGTDLYIPYTQLKARASELPADRGAKIVVYCLTGETSAIAAQTLLDLGYTNVWSLAGGMEAWLASGRSLVSLNRH
jgi:rhodanese-related sulfurtransferase